MSKIFFYGLFMDRALLTDKGFHPEPVGPAVLADYRIHIGERASLVPSASSRAYGIVMELAEEEAHALYSEPSVRAYERERVQVTLASNDVIEADCYNLPVELALTGANPVYANQLSRLVEALDFDPAYAREIAAFGDGPTVRMAVPSERDELEALQRRASLANPGDRASLSAHPDAIRLPLERIESGATVVAEHGGVIVGFASVVPRDDGDAELDALFVEPDAWGRGVGRELVKRCAARASSLGARSLHVMGNPHAEGFYTACGFEAIGQAQTRFGNGLLMRLPLV